ncbi:hypothetical protein EON63_20895 [archaeon]|nr:MAG: hypothetical protein EON63_20895 [archaeon]
MYSCTYVCVRTNGYNLIHAFTSWIQGEVLAVTAEYTYTVLLDSGAVRILVIYITKQTYLYA